MRKVLVTITFSLITALFLVACGVDTKQNEDNDKTEANESVESPDNTKESDSSNKSVDKSDSVSESEQSESDDDGSNEVSSKENNETNNKTNNILSSYSSEEIEYARVWLQLGANQDVDGIYAQPISAGEPLNSDDESTVGYPEDVVQLSGTRLVDGVVTYSSNGNGTINVYNVPKRWDGKNPAGEVFYKKIIEDTEQISIEPGDDEQVEELIKMLEID